MDDYINLFKHMEKGWDSHDADPPSEICIEITKEICSEYKSYLNGVPKPFSDGGVQIQFLGGVYLDIYNDGEIIFVNNSVFIEVELNECKQILNTFFNKLLSSSEPLSNENTTLLNTHFWDLISK